MNALYRNSVLRRATLEDVAPMIELGKQRYPGRGVEAAAEWITWHVKNPNSIVLIGKRTAGIASIVFRYGFEKRARMEALAALPGHSGIEVLQQVRAMVRWSAMMGAEGKFRLDADTGVDFGPVARRLGGTEVDPLKYPRYDIPIDGGLL